MSQAERTEYVSIYVTPEVKKEFELAKDNKSLQESIVRNFCQSESKWLEQEMQGIDEATIKYTAKLLTIKDKFQEAQNSYIEQFDIIYGLANQTFKKADNVVKDLDSKTSEVFEKISRINKSISAVDYHSLERLLSAVEKFNGMSTKEKELITLLLSKQ